MNFNISSQDRALNMINALVHDSYQDVEQVPIYPTPPLGQDMTQGQFFKASIVVI